jgi:hypothetical protein
MSKKRRFWYFLFVPRPELIREKTADETRTTFSNLRGGRRPLGAVMDLRSAGN